MFFNRSFFLFLVLIFGCNSLQEKKEFSFNKPKELTEAVLFNPYCFSDDKIVFSPSLSEDLDEFYFVLSDSLFQTYEIHKMNIQNGFISNLSFSKGSKDYSPFVVNDEIYFASHRFSNDSLGNPNIWHSRKTKEGWKEPQILDNNINTEYGEGYVSVANNGNIYFESNRPGGKGDWDIYCAIKDGDFYKKPINLGSTVNTELNESDPFIASDESFIIFGSYNRKGGFGSSDLYISFRKKNGEFGEAKNLGEKINTRYLEHNPHVSPDGRYFFFSTDKSRSKNGKYKMANFDIYFISTEFIKDLSL